MKISAEVISKMQGLTFPAIIAVSGFNGSGKSTFSHILASEINATVIGIDAFIKSNQVYMYSWNNLIDYHRLEKEVLIPFLSGGNQISYGYRDWGTNEIGENITINHNGKLIIEGVWLFRPEFLKYFDYKIWIDCPIDEAVRRGKKRDKEVHKNPQDKQWDTFYKPNDLAFYQQFQPRNVADVIIKNC